MTTVPDDPTTFADDEEVIISYRTSAKVVKTSVTVINSPFQDYTHSDDHRQSTILKVSIVLGYRDSTTNANTLKIINKAVCVSILS